MKPLFCRPRTLPFLIVVSLLPPAVRYGDAAVDPRRDFVEITPRTGAPTAFRVRDGVRVARADFFTTYRELFGLTSNDRMVELATDPPAGRFRHFQYIQYHRDIPVIGAEFSITELDGAVVFGLGRVVSGLAVSPTPAFAESKAEELARAALAARYRMRPTDLVIPVAPLVELVIVRVGTTPRLAWRTIADARRPFGQHIIDIDALTQSVIRVEARAVNAWVNTIVDGATHYDGVQSLVAETDGSSLRLHETGIIDVTTLDMANQPLGNTSSAVEVTSPGPSFADPATTAPVSAHWAAERALQYFLDRHDRNGFDGSGGVWTNYVNAALPNNAQFEPSVDGAIFGNTPNHLVPVDIVTHELTHGIAAASVGWFLNPGFTLTGETGALSEHFADIFAVLVEREVKGALADYYFGDEVFPAGGMRRIDDPNTPNYQGIQSPDTYQGNFWLSTVPTAFDQGGVHENCGVPNFGFYLLSHVGQTPTNTGVNDLMQSYEVRPIGPVATARIAYLNLVVKLGSSSSMFDAREGARQAVIELIGEYSQEHISVENAWYAVGVGNKYAATPLAIPGPMAPNVEPWKAHLEWAPGLGDTSWEVQIASGPDFASQTVVKQTVTVPKLDVTLMPGKAYYWRVRRATSDPEIQGWRPALAFVTAGKTTQPIGPNDAIVHPWQLTFTWYETPGATRYTIEVFDADGNAATERKTVTGLTAELDVPVKSQGLYWHIRPEVEIDGTTIEGDWSNEAWFSTEMPQAIIDSPVGGLPTHPWPVTYSWQPVKGADHYVVVLARSEEDYHSGSYFKSLEVQAPATTLELNMVPAYENTNEFIFWHVEVWGPPLFSDQDMGEQGDNSEPAYFQNGGDSTMPQLLKPMSGETVQCCTSSEVEVEWAQVDNAEKYIVFVRSHPEDDGLESIINTVEVPVVDKTVPTMKAEVDVEEQPGAAWASINVVAIGPEGIEGLGFENWGNGVIMMPEEPQLNFPAGDFDVDYSPTVFSFASSWSPSGKYLVELHVGAMNCSGPYFTQFTVDGQTGTFTMDLSPSGEYAWRMKALSEHVADANFLTNMYPWSQCDGFKTKAEPKPPPAPKLTYPPNDELFSPYEEVMNCWEEMSGTTEFEHHLMNPDGEITSTMHTAADTFVLPGSPDERCLWVGPVQEYPGACGTYTWKVKAKANGLWGPFSTTRTWIDVCE